MNLKESGRKQLWPALIYCYLAGKARKSGVKITDVQADI